MGFLVSQKQYFSVHIQIWDSIAGFQFDIQKPITATGKNRLHCKSFIPKIYQRFLWYAGSYLSSVLGKGWIIIWVHMSFFVQWREMEESCSSTHDFPSSVSDIHMNFVRKLLDKCLRAHEHPSGLLGNGWRVVSVNKNFLQHWFRKW